MISRLLRTSSTSMQYSIPRLAPNELKYFSNHPSELGRFLKRSRHLENTDYAKPIVVWKNSPGVIAYILMQTNQIQSLANRKRAT